VTSAPGFVSVERGGDAVAVVRIDRPKMNALSIALNAELAETFSSLASDPPGAVVVYGGERIFAAGADIDELAGGPDAARRVADGFRAATSAIASFPRVTIAAINGYALGGGLELALACDFRVAAAKAKVGLPEVLLGVIPGGGGTQRLARLVGPARAKELIFSGRQVPASEAFAMGLIDRVVDASDAGSTASGADGEDPVLGEAVSWAASFASGALAAQALAKRAVDAGLDGPLDAGLDLERAMFVEVFSTQDASIGISSFLESGPGKARFTGR
jgi:enoyl-CoA hydratase/carnithine racemase